MHVYIYMYVYLYVHVYASMYLYIFISPHEWVPGRDSCTTIARPSRAMRGDRDARDDRPGKVAWDSHNMDEEPTQKGPTQTKKA